MLRQVAASCVCFFALVSQGSAQVSHEPVDPNTGNPTSYYSPRLEANFELEHFQVRDMLRYQLTAGVKPVRVCTLPPRGRSR